MSANTAAASFRHAARGMVGWRFRLLRKTCFRGRYRLFAQAFHCGGAQKQSRGSHWRKFGLAGNPNRDGASGTSQAEARELAVLVSAFASPLGQVRIAASSSLLRYSQAAIERNATTERRQPENLEIPDGSAGSRGVQDLIPGPSPAASKVSTGGPRRIEAGGIGYGYFSTLWRIPSLPVPKTSAVSLAPPTFRYCGARRQPCRDHASRSPAAKIGQTIRPKPQSDKPSLIPLRVVFTF